jgi:DUF1009 family protein
MGRIAIIAGAGEFPILMAQEFARRGEPPVVLAIEEEADKSIESVAKDVYWSPLGKVGKILKILKKENVDSAVVAGKVHKTRIFRDLRPDVKALTLLWGLRDRKDDTIMLKVADVLAHEGIKLLPQTTHMEAYMPPKGLLTKREPTEENLRDIEFGIQVAREMGRLDIGQTVVVKRGAVLAVEAIEGTDEAILRGGSLGSRDAVVVKVAKPKQDMRFDVPAVGLGTIKSCMDGGAQVLAIEAGTTFFFQQRDALELANRHGITITAF